MENGGLYKKNISNGKTEYINFPNFDRKKQYFQRHDASFPINHSMTRKILKKIFPLFPKKLQLAITKPIMLIGDKWQDIKY